MSEKLFLVLLFLGGAIYLFFGLQIEVPFTYEPLGPRTFPLVLGTVLLTLCLLTGIGYPLGRFTPQRRVVGHGAAILFYLATFHLLGFMPATTITTYLIARLVGSSWMQGLLGGLVLAIFFYGVFHFLLGVPLPLGLLFRVGN